MALTKSLSYRDENGLIVNEKVKLTAQEETDTLAEWEATDAENAAAIIPALREQLLGMERNKAIEAMITGKKTQIATMNQTALEAAISAGGL